MTSTADLTQLAVKLASEGIYRAEAANRRVRGLYNGKYIFDTIEARHVWEHPYYPLFYLPVNSFTPDATVTVLSAVDGTNGQVHHARLSVGEKSTEQLLIFKTPHLSNLVRIPFAGIDQWFEEDVAIYQHPKDPYKRIDILKSTRSIKIALDGVTLAESSSPLFLLETSLRTRYYLPLTSVKWEYLTKSQTETYCPYKGKANYWNVSVGGKTHKDLVWEYVYPTVESGPIAGHLCFYNEKMDVWVDGVKEVK